MQQETKPSTEESRSPTAPERICDHRHHATTPPAKGRPNGASQKAAAAARLLRSADPNGFGVITFSQCVRHLALNGG